MSNSYPYHYYRQPRVQAENRANEEIKEDGERIRYGRGKRSHRYLDLDIIRKGHTTQKSWKKKRKTKYHPAGLKKKKYTYFFKELSWKQQRTLKKYFDQHNIPHKIVEKAYVNRHYWYQYTKTVFDGYRPMSEIFPWATGDHFQKRSWAIWKEVKLDKPIKHTSYSHHTEGYQITYWYNKDICLEKVLNSSY